MTWFYSDPLVVVSDLLSRLDQGKGFLLGLEDGQRIERQGGAFGDLTNDTELKADQLLGKQLANMFLDDPDVGRITVEGGADVTIAGKREMWVTIDPIDGSLNYAHRGQMTGFPHTAVVTILGHYGSEPCHFKNVLVAGVIDLRRGIPDAWLVATCPELCALSSYVRSVDGHMHHMRTLEAVELDLGKMNVIGEMYYPSNREKMVRAFAGTKGWLRSPGSAAYEMASVASGQAAAYICDQQKQHELGAGYALVKGAGGVAVDWDGVDLGNRVYDFRTQTPCILAANQRIADQILELLNRS